MEQFISSIPEAYIDLFLVVAFSLVIGLSQRKLQIKINDSGKEIAFGTDRTFTLIGVLGYVLYTIDPSTKIFWGIGGIGLLALLCCYYFFRVSLYQHLGITSIIIACITYCIPALVITQPLPFTLLVLVLVLLLTEMKETFISFANRMAADEFITLAKFIIIAGVILPILPDQPLSPNLDLTVRNIWLATVIISGLSYISYLLQKFVFRESGLLIAGILGGLYSSTATTVVLARKSKTAPEALYFRYAGAMIMASAMMFIRVAILLLIFNPSLFMHNWGYFFIMFLLSFATGLAIYYRKAPGIEEAKIHFETYDDKNPLEFKVALIFALLFVVFTLITQYVITQFGAEGLKILSFAVGVTDITPFITSLYQGAHGVTAMAIVAATFYSTLSNNIVKMFYALFFGPKGNRRPVIIGFSILCVLNLSLLFFL